MSISSPYCLYCNSFRFNLFPFSQRNLQTVFRLSNEGESTKDFADINDVRSNERNVNESEEINITQRENIQKGNGKDEKGMELKGARK